MQQRKKWILVMTDNRDENDPFRRKSPRKIFILNDKLTKLLLYTRKNRPIMTLAAIRQAM
jgi:hypothetical protein